MAWDFSNTIRPKPLLTPVFLLYERGWIVVQGENEREVTPVIHTSRRAWPVERRSRMALNFNTPFAGWPPRRVAMSTTASRKAKQPTPPPTRPPSQPDPRTRECPPQHRKEYTAKAVASSAPVSKRCQRAHPRRQEGQDPHETREMATMCDNGNFPCPGGWPLHSE